ncbi:efflux RND transporter periplasmic adaptor subunit [Undibacterium sp. RTI2.1]|uniref:efflux RND transporter periplasmic adaptor subunit n=1 Tax=unclassified Undibacterium TaxID=2630295 RepID=UPI002B23174A|nr:MULTISPECIES: efflux RND transporter periplasmic adaptor subunit [unclassified Undibacterium]MEB0031426.1 efflux RND transporter periplasmic adaptor subunit [Undibacterium sp. RTI2.1]MEB0117742.1 efflux RND transporter periplasmic adaptor subunit [Undibacterium sp. RTI2.2]
MKNKNIILLTAGLVAIGVLAGFGLYRLGLSQGMKATATPPTNTAMAAAPAKDKKVLYWHDPMVPTQKFDQPGKSPFMDMQLVPVYADGDSNGGNDGNGGSENSVSISPRVQQNLGIRTAPVVKGNLSLAVAAVGSVTYNEREVALVQARSNGFIEKLYVRAALDMVKKGQALAELYVPDWVAAQEEFLTVKRMQTSGIEGLLEAAKQRMRLAGMSDEQIHLVETSGKVHPRITITAPVGGVITELSAREGMTVMTGAPMFRINGLATIWVNADIPENSLAQIRPGNTVEASTPSLPGTTFKGKVSAILPQVDMTTRTLKARIELNNPSAQLVPGMFANIKFNSDARNNILLVPTEAIIQTGTRSVVMIAQDNGKFMPVDVETGMEANGQTEIRKGLQVGQKLVVSGQFLVDSEASLKATTTRMSDASANAAMTTTVPELPSGAKK